MLVLWGLSFNKYLYLCTILRCPKVHIHNYLPRPALAGIAEGYCLFLKKQSEFSFKGLVVSLRYFCVLAVLLRLPTNLFSLLTIFYKEKRRRELKCLPFKRLALVEKRSAFFICEVSRRPSQLDLNPIIACTFALQRVFKTASLLEKQTSARVSDLSPIGAFWKGGNTAKDLEKHPQN